MRICLYDGPNRSDLLPLVYTRPVADLLLGGMTLAKRWSLALDAEVVVETETYLQESTPSFELAVMAGCLPNPELLSAIKDLKNGQKLMRNGDMIAFSKSEGGNSYIGVMDIDGSNERMITTGHLVENPSWSNDGKRILYYKFDSNDNGGLYIIDITGYNETLIKSN